MKVVGIVPAKGASKRVPNKNMKLLCGMPLVHHALKKLLKCEFIDEVYLDTESEEMIDSLAEFPIGIIKRDVKLATNATDGHELLVYEASKVEADIYIQLLCTSPFILDETIKKAVGILSESEEYDSATLIRSEKQYLWQNGVPAYGTGRIPNSIDLPSSHIETMGLYAVTKNCIKETGRRIGNRPYMIEVSPLEAIDVNTPEEFQLAELIALGQHHHEIRNFANLSKYLSSSILSDILDDMGIKGRTLTGYKLNIPSKKALGRAKTLRIKKKKETDTSSIYDALETYKGIVENDIIIVENELPEYAYFGELNANLAIRCGAACAIIGGNTRDSKEVMDLDFPVFSEGYACHDIKNMGTMDFSNKAVHLKGVPFAYLDLVFADNDGIVSIPQEIESQVLAAALNTIREEKAIIQDIAMGHNTDDLLKDHGSF